MNLISASIIGSFNYPLKTDKHIYLFKRGRITINKNLTNFKITNVKDINQMLMKCFDLFKVPFTARTIDVQTRIKIEKPAKFNEISLLENCKPPFVLRVNLFCSNPSVSFRHSYENIDSYTFKVDENGIEHIPCIIENGQSLVDLFPSGQIKIKGKSIETNKYSELKFCNFIKTF